MSVLSSVAAAPRNSAFVRLPTVEIDGIRLHGGTKAQALAHCLDLIGDKCGGRIATANLDFFALARRDSQLRDNLNKSSLVIIDGAPIAWLARLARARAAERYAGVDLVADLCRSATPEAPLRVAVLGTTSDIATRGTQALQSLSDHVSFVMTEHPPFRPLTSHEEAAYRDKISAARPDVVLVALGCPRQERLIAEWSSCAAEAVWIGIGGALDFFAGKRRRAPGWVQRIGLEWAVRCAQDPSRLARRYFLRDFPTLFAIAPGLVWSRLVSSTRVTGNTAS